MWWRLEVSDGSFLQITGTKPEELQGSMKVVMVPSLWKVPLRSIACPETYLERQQSSQTCGTLSVGALTRVKMSWEAGQLPWDLHANTHTGVHTHAHTCAHTHTHHTVDDGVKFLLYYTSIWMRLPDPYLCILDPYQGSQHTTETSSPLTSICLYMSIWSVVTKLWAVAVV